MQECRVINICSFLHIKNTEHMFYTQIRRATTHRAPSNYVCYCYVLCNNYCCVLLCIVYYYVLCVILLLLLLMCYYVLYVIMCCIILLLSLFVCCCYVSLSIVVCCWWWCIACYVSFVEGARLMRVPYKRPKLLDVP